MKQILILSNWTSHIYQYIYQTWGPYTILMLKSCVAYFSPQWGILDHSYQCTCYLEIIATFSRWQMHRKWNFEMTITFQRYAGHQQIWRSVANDNCFDKILRIVTRISVGISLEFVILEYNDIKVTWHYFINTDWTLLRKSLRHYYMWANDIVMW